MIDKQLSIVIPVYNGAKYIDIALQSIGFIDHNEIEVIVIDDKSTDEYNTATILLEPGQASPFHYSVDNSFKRVILTTYEFKDGNSRTESKYQKLKHWILSLYRLMKMAKKSMKVKARLLL